MAFNDRPEDVGKKPAYKVDSVVFTAAFPGEQIEVKPGKGATRVAPDGLVLEVAVGVVDACAPEKSDLTDPEELRRIAQASLPPDMRQRALDMPVNLGKPANASIGSGCLAVNGHTGSRCKAAECTCAGSVTFIIKDPGTLTLDVLPERSDQLREWIEQETPVTWRDLRTLVEPNRFFYFSTWRFSLAARLMPIRGDVAAARLALGEAGVVFPVCDDPVQLPVTLTKPEGEKLARVEAMVRGFGNEDEIVRCMGILNGSKWTDGLLKSLIQKAVRYNAEQYQLSDGTRVSTEAFAAVATALLLCSRGSYSPNIHKTVRGPVAALKRAAVIGIEDGMPADPKSIKRVYRMLCTAYVLDRRSDYHPTLKVCRHCVSFVVACVQSRSVIRWRKGAEYAGTLATATVPQRNSLGVGKLEKVLGALGSFSGDIAMMGMVDRMRSTPVFVTCASRPETAVIPHIIDQHTTPAFSYALTSGGSTFAKRNAGVFDRVTGFNPRLADRSLDELDPFISDVRRTQALVMALFDKKYAQDPPTGPTVQMEHTADYGTLAGAIGVVAIPAHKATGRPQMQAMLPTSVDTEEHAVVQLPTNAKTAKAKFAKWSSKDNNAKREQYVRAAIEELRKMTLVLPADCSKAIDTARYKKVQYGREPGSGTSEWCLVDEGSGQLVAWRHARTSTFTVARLEPLAVTDPFAENAHVLRADSRGIRDNAEVECKAAMRRVPLRTLLRLHGLMRGQYGDNFRLPVPARDGGLAADELAAMPDDWDVWRLLAFFAVQVPEALWAGQLPRFRVRNTTTGQRLLRLVVHWIGEITLERSHADGAAMATLTTAEMAEMHSVSLKEHQQDALEQLQKNNRPNNVLVMGTGLGKTYTALRWALHRLTRSTAPLMLWFAPRNVLPDINKMAQTLGIASFFTKKTGKAGADQLAAALGVRAHRLYIVDRDMARKVPDALLAVAPHAFCVFDELDSYFGGTQRSSIMLAIAGVANGFLGMTATPYANRNDVGRLCMWLGLCVDFPVTKENLIVAMSSCVRIGATHNISKVYELEGVRPTAKVYENYRQFADDQYGMYKMLQHELDPHFAEAIAKTAVRFDVFVVCDGREHCRRVQALVNDLVPSNVRTGIYDSAESTVLADPSYNVVFVPKNFDRGYNGGERFQHMFRQVYGMGVSSRLQMEGRLVRLKQKSPVVTYTTVYFEDTRMSALLDKKMSEELVAMQSAAAESFKADGPGAERKRKRSVEA